MNTTVTPSCAAPSAAAEARNPRQAPEREKRQPAVNAIGYVCPLTGEILPCPKCCPVKNEG